MFPSVVLLRRARTSSGPDPYEQALGTLSVPVQSEPVLEFDISPPPTLAVLLARASDYSGLICTSPRAVQALAQILSADHPQYERWTSRPTYVTGPRTAQAVHDWGGMARGADTGTAAALAEQIVDEGMEPLLFLSGNRRRDALPRVLVEAGHRFDEVEVYRTRTRSDITLPDPPAWLVFFSPSGIEAVQASGYDVGAYSCAAIGPTTADALRARGASVRAVAETPTPEALTDSLRTALASP